MTRTLTLAGTGLWCLLAAIVRPSPFDAEWARLILCLGVLVVVPLGHQATTSYSEIARFISGAAFAGAYCLSQGIVAGALAVPWAIFTAVIALHVAARRLTRGLLPSHQLCEDAAFLLLPIGAAWAVVDRLGLQPLGFEPIIVLLTAIHFHYAGFALPLLTAEAAKARDDYFAATVCIAVMLGVPLVAAGITAAQLGMGTWLETGAGVWLAGAGTGASALLLQHASSIRQARIVRAMWAVAGVSLGASMILAALYACRFHLHFAWLDIPWMRATHGTANAIGFALIGLLAGRIEVSAGAHRGDKAAPEISCPSASINPSSTSTSCT